VDQYRQVRRDSESWQDDIEEIADLLEMDGIVHFGYAAEASCHPILVIDGSHLDGSVYGLGPVGVGAESYGEYAFWDVGSWSNGSDWLRIGGYHDPNYLVAKKIVVNPVDAIALAILLNWIERERARRRDVPWQLDLEELEKGWLTEIKDASELAQKLLDT
jgi:hypothetical protein